MLETGGRSFGEAPFAPPTPFSLNNLRSEQPNLMSEQQIDILWITAGLGGDGDTISMTAATQRSRTVRSFDPYTPCGVHMFTGEGRVNHSPMFGAGSH